MHASTIRPLQLRPVYRPLVDGDDELINHVVFLGYPMFRQTPVEHTFAYYILGVRLCILGFDSGPYPGFQTQEEFLWTSLDYTVTSKGILNVHIQSYMHKHIFTI